MGTRLQQPSVGSATKKTVKPAIYEWRAITLYRVFSHDVTAAILVSQNNETAAMLVSQTNPRELNFFLMQTLSFIPKICIDSGHVSENTLLNKLSIIKVDILFSTRL